MPKVFFLFLLLPFYAACQSVPVTEPQFHQMLADMYGDEIEVIRPEALPANALLLDGRKREEFEVSHIPDARWVGYREFTPQRVEDIDVDRPIVVYCSVGYRSERLAEDLKDLGFRRVYNLYGGIFQWKNEGRSVVNMDKQPTDRVHTYNRKWSKWLFNGQAVW